jgi:hypothetical protein
MLEKIKKWFKSAEVAYDPQVVEAAARDKIPLPPGPTNKSHNYLCEKGKHDYNNWKPSPGGIFQVRFCKHCNFRQSNYQ